MSWPLGVSASTFTSTVAPCAAEAGDSLVGVVVVGVFRLLARISTRLLPPGHVRRLSHSLVVAGNPFGWRVSHFVTCKAIMALVLSFLGVVLFLRPAHLLLGSLLAGDRRTLPEAIPHLERAAESIPAARDTLEKVRLTLNP